MKLQNIQKYSKLGGLVVLLILLLVATIFLGKNASNFFAKASSCTFQNVQSVQVTANSAVISWTTTDTTRGKVEYGTDSSNLNFTKIEDADGTNHNVNLTLLTPNTTYYYVININNKKCDSSGQSCTGSCAAWNFTTLGVSPQPEVEKVMPTVSPTPEVVLSPTVLPSKSQTTPVSSPTASLSVTPTSSGAATLSTFCEQVIQNIGATSASTNWTAVKQYDLDGNNIVNSKDVFKCQKDGK